MTELQWTFIPQILEPREGCTFMLPSFFFLQT